jgi:hypothetical protein
MKKRFLLLCFALISFAAFPAFAGDDDDKPHTGDISADAEFMSGKDWYFICIEFLNLTGYPVQIDEVSGSDPALTYHGAGYVIPYPKDGTDTSASVCYIGWRRNNGVMEGPDMNVKFHLVGREGSRPCTLRIVNHYAFWDGNEIAPEKCFPADQCPPLAGPDGQGGTPVPLYHNVKLPKNGHNLTVLATLAFKDFGAANRQLSPELRQQIGETADNAISHAESLPVSDLLGKKHSEDEFLK